MPLDEHYVMASACVEVGGRGIAGGIIEEHTKYVSAVALR